MTTNLHLPIIEDGRFFGIIGGGAWVFPDDLYKYYAGPSTLQYFVGLNRIDWYQKILKTGKRILLPKTTSGVKLIWREYKNTESGLTLKY